MLAVTSNFEFPSDSVSPVEVKSKINLLMGKKGMENCKMSPKSL